jgi:hypothetical protein
MASEIAVTFSIFLIFTGQVTTSKGVDKMH